MLLVIYITKQYKLKLSESITQAFVTNQISATFIITALLSLVANIEKKYIYGERAIGRLFTGKFFTFTKCFFILIIIMFINIYLLILGKNPIWILYLSILSFIILAWLIFRAVRIFLQSKTIKKDLEVKYYKEEIGILENKKKKSISLLNLKEKCLQLILTKNIDYLEYTELYIDLIKLTLFNNRKALQEYYTELNFDHTEVLNDYLTIIEHLLITNENIRGINKYSELLNILNYYNTYIPYFKIHTLHEKIVETILLCKNSIDLTEYSTSIAILSKQLLEQAYLSYTTDFSFTRLGKLKLQQNIYKINDNIFSEVYEMIWKNSYVNSKDKSKIYLKIYDSFRMSSCDMKLKMNDITTFSYKMEILKPREIPSHIIAIPTAKLLLQILSNNDINNYKLFIQMNIGEKEMSLSIVLVILTLIKIKLQRHYTNLYCEYYKMHVDKAINVIGNNYRYLQKSLCINALPEIYNDIVTLFIENSQSLQVGGYFTDYMIKFRKETIDTVFAYLNDRFNLHMTFEITKKDCRIIELLKNIFDRECKAQKKQQAGC